jgi:hypothetical protein
MEICSYDLCPGEQASTIVVVPASVQGYARHIEENWHKATGGIFKVAKLCAEAKNTLTKGQLKELIGQLPFDRSTFSKLTAIGEKGRLSDPELRRLLPPHYSIVYELTKLTDEECAAAVDEGVIHPKSTRVEVIDWKIAHRGEPKLVRNWTVAPDRPSVRNQFFAALILPATCDAQRIVVELERLRERYGVHVVFGGKANEYSTASRRR